MKILHVLNTPRAEGTVKLALDWLAEPACRQEVLVLGSEPAEMTGRLRHAAAWYAEGGRPPAGVRKAWWIARLVAQTCRQRQPDLVICWVNGFSPWVLGGARLAGVRRLVTHAGNPPTPTAIGRVQTSLSGLVVWLTRGRMVCCSRYVAAQYGREMRPFSSVLRVVYNCAPVARIAEAAGRARAGRQEMRPTIVMVATLESHKDHATLLQAMPAVVSAVPKVRLWLVGEGRLRSSLQSLAASLGLGDAVQFLGSRSDVPELLGQSDAFAFSTTREEGLGTVLIEAMAAGLPVVASDVPACRELLVGGGRGTLVPPGDAAALAGALVRCLQSARPAPVASPLPDWLREFTPARMLREYQEAVA